MQMEAHHYCIQVNEDFAQCALFDGNAAASRLTGVEYIISAHLYDTLPADEKAYWHPHNFEILSGQLRLPGVPDVAEKEALKSKINSYGKTWHTWMTGMYGQKGEPAARPRAAAMELQSRRRSRGRHGGSATGEWAWIRLQPGGTARASRP